MTLTIYRIYYNCQCLFHSLTHSFTAFVHADRPSSSSSFRSFRSHSFFAFECIASWKICVNLLSELRNCQLDSELIFNGKIELPIANDVFSHVRKAHRSHADTTKSQSMLIRSKSVGAIGKKNRRRRRNKLSAQRERERRFRFCSFWNNLFFHGGKNCARGEMSTNRYLISV